MPWIPEAGLPLTATLNGNAVEAATMRLWREYLAGYFDGNAHGGRQFPVAAEFVCGAGKPNKEGLTLQIVSGGQSRRPSHRWQDGDHLTVAPASWTMVVRGRVLSPRADLHNSESLCRWGADALYSLLGDPEAVRPLGWSGIPEIRPDLPKLGPLLDQSASRSLVCRANLTYSILPRPLFDRPTIYIPLVNTTTGANYKVALEADGETATWLYVPTTDPAYASLILRDPANNEMWRVTLIGDVDAESLTTAQVVAGTDVSAEYVYDALALSDAEADKDFLVTLGVQTGETRALDITPVA